MRIRLYPLHRFADSRWVRGVAWSILGGSGPLDSGSNPDGPIPTHTDCGLKVGPLLHGPNAESCIPASALGFSSFPQGAFCGNREFRDLFRPSSRVSSLGSD